MFHRVVLLRSAAGQGFENRLLGSSSSIRVSPTNPLSVSKLLLLRCFFSASRVTHCCLADFGGTAMTHAKRFGGAVARAKRKQKTKRMTKAQTELAAAATATVEGASLLCHKNARLRTPRPLSTEEPRVKRQAAAAPRARGGTATVKTSKQDSSRSQKLVRPGVLGGAEPNRAMEAVPDGDLAEDVSAEEDLEDMMERLAHDPLAAVRGESADDEVKESFSGALNCDDSREENCVDGVVQADEEEDAEQEGITEALEQDIDGTTDSSHQRRHHHHRQFSKHQKEAETAAAGEDSGDDVDEVPPSYASNSIRDTDGGAPVDTLMAKPYLYLEYPDLAAEYVAAGTKANTTPVKEVLTDSAVVASWRCPTCSNIWKCGVFVRCILKNGCPSCATSHKETLAIRRPDLLQLWDHSRNDPFLKPEELAVDSRVTVFWKCPTCRESFAARVKDRATDTVRCPSCALLRSQSAEALTSDGGALQQEWHPLKNGDLRMELLSPTDYKTKVWWLCSGCGHEWEASLATRLSRKSRKRGNLCPACHGKGTAELL